MKEDLARLGYTFEFQRLDAQKFLVRQRRNRIWGSADVSIPDAETYGQHMASTVRSVQSDNLFPWEDCFDTSMASSSSSVGLPERVLRQLETAIADAQLIDGSSCVFLDVSKSDAFMEQATNVATCIRPTHDIYSHQLGRKLTVPELWCCQGLWRDDFPCPQTIDELLNENPSKAQDLAGLATGWRRFRPYSNM